MAEAAGPYESAQIEELHRRQDVYAGWSTMSMDNWVLGVQVGMRWVRLWMYQQTLWVLLRMREKINREVARVVRLDG